MKQTFNLTSKACKPIARSRSQGWQLKGVAAVWQTRPDSRHAFMAGTGASAKLLKKAYLCGNGFQVFKLSTWPGRLANKLRGVEDNGDNQKAWPQFGKCSRTPATHSWRAQVRLPNSSKRRTFAAIGFKSSNLQQCGVEDNSDN